MLNFISSLNKVATKEVETAGSIAYQGNNTSNCAYSGNFNAGSSSSSSSSSFSAMA